MGWVIAALVVFALLLFYAAWAARRLDRLHARVDAAKGALDTQLRARAEAALTLAAAGVLDRRGSDEVRAAATVAAQARELDHDREECENALSRALRDGVPAGTSGPAAAGLADAAVRASFARRFHNDAVRDVEIVRERRVIRWLHLAGRAPRPAYFEVDDGPLETTMMPSAAAPTIEP